MTRKEGNQRESTGNIFCHSYSPAFSLLFLSFIEWSFPVVSVRKRELSSSHTRNPLLQPKDSERSRSKTSYQHTVEELPRTSDVSGTRVRTPAPASSFSKELLMIHFSFASSQWSLLDFCFPSLQGSILGPVQWAHPLVMCVSGIWHPGAGDPSQFSFVSPGRWLVG